jgi:hypothetical protein
MGATPSLSFLRGPAPRVRALAGGELVWPQVERMHALCRDLGLCLELAGLPGGIQDQDRILLQEGPRSGIPGELLGFVCLRPFALDLAGRRRKGVLSADPVLAAGGPLEGRLAAAFGRELLKARWRALPGPFWWAHLRRDGHPQGGRPTRRPPGAQRLLVLDALGTRLFGDLFDPLSGGVAAPGAPGTAGTREGLLGLARVDGAALLGILRGVGRKGGAGFPEPPGPERAPD